MIVPVPHSQNAVSHKVTIYGPIEAVTSKVQIKCRKQVKVKIRKESVAYLTRSSFDGLLRMGEQISEY